MNDPAPYVCPGCFAIGAEPHAGFCLDAIVERTPEQPDEFEPDDLNGTNDWECEP